jgi:hypothetical protein
MVTTLRLGLRKSSRTKESSCQSSNDDKVDVALDENLKQPVEVERVGMSSQIGPIVRTTAGEDVNSTGAGPP